jgi:hypothetical protein
LQAELDLVICSGALRGKHQTFALVDDLVPPAPPISEDEALAELTRRYFSSHGPATLKDFIWWSSLTAAQARRGLELLKQEGLRPLTAAGRTHWLFETRTPRTTPEPSVHLLQPFDEYIIAYTESRNVLAIAGHPISPPRAPRPPNLLVGDGQVIGTWRPSVALEEALVEVHLARPLDRAMRIALDHELERYGRFLERPVRLLVTSKAKTRGTARAAARQ